MQAEMKHVTKDMTMGEIIEKYPAAAEVMSSFGLHCVGCSLNPHETLEAGTIGHGMSEEEFENLLSEVNEVVARSIEAGESRDSAESSMKELKITLTEKASGKLKHTLKEKDREGWGIRIRIASGGCSGFLYAMDFDEVPSEQDTVFEFGGVKVFVDPDSLKKLDGTEIDYVETLEASGFRFNNPNAKASCGCGKSFR